jgi:uncharacterized iron-regulated protein
MDAGGWREGASGAAVGRAEALGRLAAARVVLLGEQHDRAEDHRWQAEVVAGLAALRPEVVVGFEMFPRAVQPALDAWVAGGLDFDAFLSASRWREVWGFDPGLYAPLLNLCRDLRLPMRAMNVDRPIVSLVGRDGWEALPPAERTWLTPARAAPEGHRRYLFEMTGGARPDRAARSAEDPAFDRFVRAQQVWDRAFACTLAEVVRERPAALAVGILGRGHAEYGFGTPDQLDDLGVAPVLVAVPELARSWPPPVARPIADLVFARTSLTEIKADGGASPLA